MRHASQIRGILIASLCLLSFSAFAQPEPDAGYNDREAADHYFAKEGYYTAVELYKKAYSDESSASEKAALIFKVAESYRMMDDQVQAEVWYRRAIKSRYEDPMAYYWLSKSLQSQGRFSEAVEELADFREKGGDTAKAAELEKSIEYARELTDKPSKYVVDPEVMLNTEFYDFAPAFTGGENSELVLCSSRLGSTGIDEFNKTGESYEDFFITKKDEKGKWSEPGRMESTLNTVDHEGAATFTKDGMRMYFTKCYHDKNEGCDIFMSTKNGAKWGEAQKVPLKQADQKENTFGHPALTTDDKVMVFASNRPGGQGGKDLWMAKYNDGANSWGAPVNLGPGVNTPGDEMFPYIRSNGELYYSSNGLKGMGGLDIFVASKTGENEWSDPKNMGYPMNTNSNDFGIVYQGDFERGYFTSDREGGKGHDDIYSFSLPEVNYAFEGYVYDKDEQFPIQDAYVKVVGSDGSSFETTTDSNGSFAFGENGEERFVNGDVNYSIQVGATDYLVAKDNISTVGLDESTNFVKEFFIQSTKPPGGVISLPEVQYDLGKATLREASKDSLNYLYNILADNPTIVIELQAHTDSRGRNDSNLKLSQARAQSCVDYLASRGINSERMKAKGYGETRLRIPDSEIAKAATKEEKDRLHQMNRRTEFSVLNWNYQPK